MPSEITAQELHASLLVLANPIAKQAIAERGSQ
jgi:hypothetical protein